MEYRKFGDTYVLRLDQGEEVMESLRRFAEAEQISLASVQGIGALSAFDLKAHHYEGCYEITSLLGTIDTMDGNSIAIFISMPPNRMTAPWADT